MTLFTALLLGHLIADFPLQTTRIYHWKVDSRWGLVLHVLIHLGITAILLHPDSSLPSLLLLLGITHFGIDLVKVRIPVKPRRLKWALFENGRSAKRGSHRFQANRTIGFLIDQIAHLLVIALLAYGWRGQLDSLLPMGLLLPLIGYTSFLSLLVFGWVVACDLQERGWGEYPAVQWARVHLLHFSQYAGLPLLAALLYYISLSDLTLHLEAKRLSLFHIRRVLS